MISIHFIAYRTSECQPKSKFCFINLYFPWQRVSDGYICFYLVPYFHTSYVFASFPVKAICNSKGLRLAKKEKGKTFLVCDISHGVVLIQTTPKMTCRLDQLFWFPQENYTDFISFVASSIQKNWYSIYIEMNFLIWFDLSARLTWILTTCIYHWWRNMLWKL